MARRLGLCAGPRSGQRRRGGGLRPSDRARRGHSLAGRLGLAGIFRIAAGMLKDRRRTVGLDRQATYEMSDLNGDLVWALQQLPPQQRAAVVLFYYADHPIREIAAILDASLVAVRVNLSRGRKRLREILESNHA